jgi:hypothetical protein
MNTIWYLQSYLGWFKLSSIVEPSHRALGGSRLENSDGGPLKTSNSYCRLAKPGKTPNSLADDKGLERWSW